MVPSPPEVITAGEIAAKLCRTGPRYSREFLRAVQRCLRNMRLEGSARSVPHGDWPQLGWHRTATLS